MKKFVCAVLAMVMLLALAVSACAEEKTTANFTFTTPCEAIDDSELYLHHGNGYVTKKSNNHTLQVKYHVVQNGADETNRIAAFCSDTGKTMGAHWIPANDAKYPITSNAIEGGKGYLYTAAGRGNTNYVSKYGLDSITITGTIYSDD